MKCKKWMALLLAVIVVLSLALTGCGSDDETDSTEDKSEVVASIGDTEITLGQLDEMLELSAVMAGQDIDSMKENEDIMKYLRASMLNNMVGYHAMRMYLEEEGINPFPDNYQEQLEQFTEQAQTALEDREVSDDTIKFYFNLSYYSEPISEKVLAEITEEEIEEYYEENKESYTSTGPAVRASHILVADEETAQEIYEKAMAGEDFAKLAEEYGTDGTRTRGGDLGGFGPERMVTEFSDAAFALKTGEISQPVQTQFGYHIIKLTGRIEEGTMPVEWVADEIRSSLSSSKYSELVQGLVDRYGVEYFGEFAQILGGQ